ncbi:MAG: hypothetical protein JO055_01905 [Alphaproteobacteria bacterium]|nr:hypothetical protein [Alphaproteobacteria bacterium]
MRLRVLAIALPLLGLAYAGAVAQQTLLATAPGGPSYDVVANCLMKRMTPVLTAVPVVRPPPTNEAEVYLYVHGTRETGSPVANFVVTQQDNGSSTIKFEGPTQYAAAAAAAAKQCAQ